MTNINKARATSVVKLMNWLEKNAHRFTKKNSKRTLAEVRTYYRALKSGNLSKRHADRLARQMLVGLKILIPMLIACLPLGKEAVPFALGGIDSVLSENRGLAASLSTLLQKAFSKAPRAIRSLKKIARRLRAASRSAARIIKRCFIFQFSY